MSKRGLETVILILFIITSCITISAIRYSVINDRLEIEKSKLEKRIEDLEELKDKYLNESIQFKSQLDNQSK